MKEQDREEWKRGGKGRELVLHEREREKRLEEDRGKREGNQ